MTRRILTLAATAALLVASQAHAQQAARPAAAAQPQVDPTIAAVRAAQANPTGPLVPGLCILNRDGLVATSTVGQYVARRLEELEQQVNTEVTAAGTKAQTDLRTLEGQRASIGDQNYVNQARQIAAGFEQLREIRTAELRETAGRAENNILQQATPLIVDSFKAKNCSLILNAGSVVMSADAMDITEDVRTRLNAKITQFPIERVQIQLQQQGAAPPAAGGAPPVAQTPAAGGRPAAGGARAPQGPTR